jgi:hypothetical protein
MNNLKKLSMPEQLIISFDLSMEQATPPPPKKKTANTMNSDQFQN